MTGSYSYTTLSQANEVSLLGTG